MQFRFYLPCANGHPMLPADILSTIQRPSRYLGGEMGSVHKDSSTVEVRFALAFPDVYEVGMSHLGFAILYRVLNDLPWAAAERAYAPWPDLEEQLRARRIPLSALESERPLAEFDIVGFTLQYELSYTNILNMLDLAGIPRRREARDASHPLIVVGGPCAFNPEPLADFFDCAVIGDGEEAVVEVAAAVRAAKRGNETRTELLSRLAAIEGVYVPSDFTVSYHADGTLAAIEPQRPDVTKVRRRFLVDLDQATFPTAPIVPLMQTVHDRVAVEIARGCTRGCRFCQAGYIYRPVRERSPEQILSIIDASLAATGYEEVSLLSLSTGDYGCIEPLLKGLMARHGDDRVAVSLPSLRVGSLTPELMEEIKKVRKTGFTLAPEAGSERLRNVINKGITEEDLLAATRSAFELGWRVVKLYFMTGLPSEEEADLDALIDLSARAKRTGKGTQGGADVNVSVSTYVPKAHTPFQWEAQIGIAETLRRQRRLRDGLAAKKLRMKWHEAQLSFLEGVFARGDRRLGAVLEKAVDLGCRFDGWRDHFRFDLWQQAFAECGLEPDWYLRARALDETLPWEHLDCGIPKSFLLAERQRAFAETYTPDCRGGACSGCGVCDFEALRLRLHARHDLPAPPPAPAAVAFDPETSPRYKLRLRLRKGGKARFISHLEFMTVLHRALRRAQVPVRYSAGFHPAPRVSFPDALPTGVESEAEIIDVELTRPLSARELAEALNERLPAGIRVLEAATIEPKSPTPAVCIAASHYRVELPPQAPADLAERIAAFLAASTCPVEREKGRKQQTVDLRRDTLGVELEGGALWLRLAKGSPVVLAAHLLGLDAEGARALRLTKTSVTLR